jgi:hypothetical protein
MLVSGHVLQRADYLAQVIFVWMVQMVLCVILMYEIINGGTLTVYPNGFVVVVSRFLCAVVLHMSLQNELAQGLNKMKFALNHSYKFKPGLGYVVAFFAGFLQTSMIMSVEIINIFSILSYPDTLNVVICFLALAIIAQFDNYFYEAFGNNQDKALLTSEHYDDLLYTIRRTSSRAGYAAIEPNKLEDPSLDYLKDPQFAPKKWKLSGVTDSDNYICVRFRERSVTNKVLTVIYRMFRCVYVSFWFYFFPFSCLLGSFFIPYYVNKYNGTTAAVDPETTI